MTLLPSFHVNIGKGLRALFGGVMNLYHALQSLLDKISDTAVDAKYDKTEKEMLIAVLENQIRLAEAVLVLGSLVHGIVGQEITVEVKPPKGGKTH